jgi:uncharacterized protein (TIGR02246 family)
MRRTSLFWSFGAVLALAACTQPATDTTEAVTTVDPAADIAAIEAQVDAFLEGFNAGDIAALGPLYTEDAIQMPPDGPVLEGGAAIIASIEEFIAGFSATQTATVDEVGVFGDVGFSRGTWNVSQTPTAGGDEQLRNGKWFILHQRQADGSWQVWRWIWNEEGTAPEAM